MTGILDEDIDDTLINVNLIDDERAARNVENKKKKPGYQAYDDSEFDEYGTVCGAFCTLQFYPGLLLLIRITSRFYDLFSEEWFFQDLDHMDALGAECL